MIVPEGYSPDNIPRGKLVELHTVGPNENNADIVILENGIVPEYMPPIMYRERLADKLGAELPRVKVAKEVQGETKTKVLGKKVQKPDLRKGMPPLPQFVVVDELDWERETAVNQIVENLEELGWFENIDFDIKENVENCLKYLSNKKLAYYDEKEKVAHLTPKSSDRESFYKNANLEKDGYNIEEGPYPVVRLIRDYVSNNVSMRKGEIIDIIYGDWRWVRNRKGAKKWIDRTSDLGYIKRTVEGKYEVHRTI